MSTIIAKQLQTLGRPDLLRVLQQWWGSLEPALMGEEGRQLWANRCTHQLHGALCCMSIEYQAVLGVHRRTPTGHHKVHVISSRQCPPTCAERRHWLTVCRREILQLQPAVPALTDQVSPHQQVRVLERYCAPCQLNQSLGRINTVPMPWLQVEDPPTLRRW